VVEALLPNCPEVPKPQQAAMVLPVAQEKFVPTETVETERLARLPSTLIGVEVLAEALLPICPLVPTPQQ